MRLRFTTLITVFLTSSVYAQPQDLKKIYLAQEQYKVEEILNILETEFDQVVSHSLSAEDLHKIIVLSVGNYGLEDLLAGALPGNGYEYSRQKGKVLIRSIRSESPKGSKVTLRGNIIDAQTGEALIGATIYVKELRDGVVSNKYGFYSLTVPAGNYVVVVAYLGYQSKVMTLEFGSNTRLDLDLAQDKKV